MHSLDIQVPQVCINSTNCIVNLVKNSIANQWVTLLFRAVVITSPHPIVTLTLLELDFKMLLFRFLLRGGFSFATIACFIPDNIGVLNVELSFCESACLFACTKWNSRTDTASA